MTKEDIIKAFRERFSKLYKPYFSWEKLEERPYILLTDIEFFLSQSLDEYAAYAVKEERARILLKLKVYSVTAPPESRAATFTPEQFMSILTPTELPDSEEKHD